METYGLLVNRMLEMLWSVGDVVGMVSCNGYLTMLEMLWAACYIAGGPMLEMLWNIGGTLCCRNGTRTGVDRLYM